MSGLTFLDFDDLGSPCEAVVIEDGAPPRRIQAGDSFVMEPGFKGAGRVLETTRKLRSRGTGR